MTIPTVESWIPESQSDEIDYYEYWNDEEIEKQKDWYYIGEDHDFARMEDALEKTGRLSDLNQCIDVLKTEFHHDLGGIGIDLAAGNLWAVPYILNNDAVKKLYCLEYSKHRLLKLGPRVLEHYKAPSDKVVLVHGSFYDLHLDDNSVDFVLLASAFHHAHQPHQLLSELDRVLKKDGVVIIIGEHIVKYWRSLFRHVAKLAISKCVPQRTQEKLFSRPPPTSKLFPNPSELFPPDPVLGDHYYTMNEYRAMVSKYRVRHLRNKDSMYQSFVLVRT